MPVAWMARPLTVRVPKLAPPRTASDTSVMFIRSGALARDSSRRTRPLPLPRALTWVSQPATPALVVLLMRLDCTPPAAPTPATPRPTAPASVRMRSRLLAVTATVSVAITLLT